MSDWVKECFRLQFRIVTFRATAEELFNIGWKHLPFGLFWALLAGIGRAWDNPTAAAILRSGMPSVAYVFALSLFLWLFIAPLKPEQWRYSRVLAFVGLTALPGVLYAVPLELMLSPDDAIIGNSFLLLIVASWRVALLTWFLWKSRFGRWGTATAVCLPLSLIILGLVATDHLVKTFAVMGGYRYFVVENETLAKPYLEEQNKIPTFSTGSMNKLDTRGAHGHHTVYRQAWRMGPDGSGNKNPPGLREISWDDPEYMAPDPVLAVARGLTWASMIAAPFFAVVYVIICIRNLVQGIRSWRKATREQRKSEKDVAIDGPKS